MLAICQIFLWGFSFLWEPVWERLEEMRSAADISLLKMNWWFSHLGPFKEKVDPGTVTSSAKFWCSPVTQQTRSWGGMSVSIWLFTPLWVQSAHFWSASECDCAHIHSFLCLSIAQYLCRVQGPLEQDAKIKTPCRVLTQKLPLKPFSGDCIFFNLLISQLGILLGWPRSFLGFSITSYEKNPNVLFGQPNILKVLWNTFS